ncbi:MAG: M28 family peptidase, partial [Dehalococcoidia bacterium]|nr:M28 family peptidase [Dehalococcoidia bacterium]
LGDDEAAAIQAVLNLDVVGFGDDLRVTGDSAIEDLVLGIARAEGIDLLPSTIALGSSSDHASFLDAGIPAGMLFTEDVGPIHTPEDTADIVDSETVATAVQLVVATAQELL